MKNATCHCAILLITGMCSTDVYCSKQPAAVAPKETITHHFFVSGIGAEENVDAAKICGGAENVVKNRNSANIRKWIAGFITLGITLLEARVFAHNNCMSCLIDMGNLSALLINILLVPSSCFCIASQFSGG